MQSSIEQDWSHKHPRDSGTRVSCFMQVISIPILPTLIFLPLANILSFRAFTSPFAETRRLKVDKSFD